ncbi:MAG: TraB family protein [Chitinivibrionales bacterium]|nr:TraB family protein [Chitinivibrionales bacterium]
MAADTRDSAPLPPSVRVVTVAGKTIYLVGTAHVSQASVDDVRQTVEATAPDAICIELCESRYRSLVEQTSWRTTDIFRVLRERKALLLLAQLIMTSFYRRLGSRLGVTPGAEMLEGARLANERGANLVLADRPIEITLRRVWGFLGFFAKMRLVANLFAGILTVEHIDDEVVEQLKNRDQLDAVMEEFAQALPKVRERLIDERDIYLAQRIRSASGERVVAVVGAGHVDGIIQQIQVEHQLEPLEQLPPKSLAPTVLKWAIPLAIVALLVYGFFRGDREHSLHSVYIWVAVNGILAAIGAAAALGHPLTVLSSLVAAPLTSLNPFMAAGWVAGLVQALVKRPTVADFEDLPNAIASVRGFWTNPVTRVLLVVVLANLGSTLGTLISGSWIAVRVF